MGGVPLHEDGKDLETEGGDSCTTMWMCLMPLSCAPRMVDFLLSAFHHS